MNRRGFVISAWSIKLLCTAALLGLVFYAASCQRQALSRGGTQDMDNLNLTGLPIVIERESFSMLIDDNGRVEDKDLYTFIEEATNVRANLMLFPNQAAQERKNILIASGNYPDVIAGWLLGQADVMRLAREGVIIPLGDLIDKYAPNIKEALDLPGVRESMTLPDGKIYSPPYVIEEPLVSFNPWINMRYLQQLGLPMPSTTEEFKQTLIAFRDRLPPINGQRIIPFSGDPNNLDLGSLAGWFGLNASSSGRNSGYFSLINGQLEHTAIRPEYREFIKYFADLYAEGLIDPELFTQDKASWQAKGKIGGAERGLFGVAFSYAPGDFSESLHHDMSVFRYVYYPMPVLRAPGVEKPVFRRNGFGVTTFPTQFVITDLAANPITIIRWLDHIYDFERSIEADYGPIGIKFERLPDGNYREIDILLLSEEIRSRNDWGMPFTVSLPKFRRPGYKLIPPVGKNPEFREKDMVDELYAPYLETQTLPILWIPDDRARRAADIQTAVVAYVRQKQAEWISGQANVDDEWDGYVEQINRLGLSELLQIRRDALSRRN